MAERVESVLPEVVRVEAQGARSGLRVPLEPAAVLRQSRSLEVEAVVEAEMRQVLMAELVPGLEDTLVEQAAQTLRVRPGVVGEHLLPTGLGEAAELAGLPGLAQAHRTTEQQEAEVVERLRVLRLVEGVGLQDIA